MIGIGIRTEFEGQQTLFLFRSFIAITKMLRLLNLGRLSAVAPRVSRSKAALGAAMSFAIGGGSLAALSATTKRLSTQAEAALPASQKITLYQYQVCPFCNKAQTFIEYSGVPHKRVEVNPLSKKEMKFSEYKKVPFMVVEGANGEKSQVNGSDEIVDYIAAMTGNNTPDTADTPKWREWVNERLIKLLPPNIYRTPGEALQAFDYIAKSSNFSYFERLSATYTGALAMYFIARKSLTKYNIKDARAELAEEMNRWANEGLPAGKDFHGGSKPSKADLAVYGVIRSIEGNYATWTDMQKMVSPKFWEWYGKVKKSVQAPILTS